MFLMKFKVGPYFNFIHYHAQDSKIQLVRVLARRVYLNNASGARIGNLAFNRGHIIPSKSVILPKGGLCMCRDSLRDS
mgnify:FL=1